MKKIVLLLLVVLIPAIVAEAAVAAYPDKTVQLVVPWGAGGRTDVIARLFATHAPKYLGQAMVVINKPGGADVLRWLQQHGDPYLLSAWDFEGKVGIDYGVYGAPETFVIDKLGVIRFKQIGPITPEVLEKTLLPLLAKLNS